MWCFSFFCRKSSRLNVNSLLLKNENEISTHYLILYYRWNEPQYSINYAANDLLTCFANLIIDKPSKKLNLINSPVLFGLLSIISL